MYRILLVEDSPTERHQLSEMLRQCGLDVMMAVNGLQAVAIARRRRPDLILMDIEMPRMNGLDACRKLSRDPEAKDIPIVIVSSCDIQACRMRALMRGAVAYLAKPVRPQELCDQLAAVLPSKAEQKIRESG